jgi:hypothetical protein
MFGGADADKVANAISSPRTILLRVFVHFYGRQVILLLSGYDKSKDPSQKRQARDIVRARRFLTAWNEQQKRKQKAARTRKPGSTAAKIARRR